MICPVVAYGSRASDLAGKVWCGPRIVLFVGQLWWQKPWLAVMQTSGISANKPGPPSYSSASSSSAGRLLLSSLKGAPMDGAKFGSGGSSSLVNKLVLIFRQIHLRHALFLLLTSHGGSGENKGRPVAVQYGEGRGILEYPDVDSAAALAIPKRCPCVDIAISDHRLDLTILVCSGGRKFFFLHYVRISFSLCAALCVSEGPRCESAAVKLRDPVAFLRSLSRC